MKYGIGYHNSYGDKTTVAFNDMEDVFRIIETRKLSETTVEGKKLEAFNSLILKYRAEVKERGGLMPRHGSEPQEAGESAGGCAQEK